MSGIGGVLAFDAGADPADCARLEAALVRRGPDGSGTYCEGPAGLVQRMLHATPEARHETQPLVRGPLALVADCRLDNREDLIRELGLLPGPSGVVTDAEIILSAYEAWGEAAPERLLGDFAFAVWDGSRRRLFCARDHFGAKPFVYYHRPGRLFAFASEVGALCALSWLPRRLNEEVLADSLVYALDRVDPEATFYRDILRLPSARSLTVTRGGAAVRRYWTPDPRRELRLPSEEDYFEGFREVFTRAVVSRLRGGASVGSMLSGGLDSGSIVVTAREMACEGGGRLATFSAISDDALRCSEAPYIQAVLARGGLDAAVIRPRDAAPFREDFARVLASEAEPIDSCDMFVPRVMYGAAARRGLKALLDGVDGDIVSAHGFDYMGDLLRRLRFRELAAELPRFARRMNCSPARAFVSHCLRPVTPEPLQKVWRRLRGQDRLSHYTRLLRPGFAARAGVPERLQAVLARESVLPKDLREEHATRITSQENAEALERYDRTAAFFGLEARHPFFDRRVTDFCIAAPPPLKIRRGWSKYVLRRAMEGRLPEMVRWRVGKGSAAPGFIEALVGARRDLLAWFVGGGFRHVEEFVDIGEWKRLYEKWLRGVAKDDLIDFWQVVAVACWLARQ